VSRLEARSRLPRAIVAWALARPGAALASWFLLALLASLGVARLEIETSTESVLDRRHPAWAYYQSTQDEFGGDEILTVLMESKRAFDPVLLAEVVRLSDHYDGFPGVERVDSLATVPLVYATPDGDLSLEPALAGGVPETRDQQAELEARVGRDRIAPRNLISPDGHSLAVNLVLEKGAEALYDDILLDLERELEDRQAWVSGVPIFRTATDARTRGELALFVPITVVAVGALLFALFGSFAAVVIPLGASGLGTWLVLGTMGMLGTPLTISTAVLPSILLALGCAYSMHLLSAAAGRGRGEELAASLGNVALPVALSGLTTAVGFVAVSLVEIDTIRDVGAYGALGVLLVVSAVLTAAPAALRLWPLPERRARLHGWFRGAAVERLVTWVAARRRAILLAWVAALLAVSAGLARIHVETDVILWFQRSDPIRVAYDAIRERLSGISPMNVVIEAAGDARVSDPEVVAAIDGLTAHLNALPRVGRAFSIADLLRQLHGGFSGDASQPLPSSSAEIAQLLLLLESKDYTFDLITRDRTTANVRLRVDDNGSEALLEVAAEATDWWAAHGPAGFRARTTGIMYEFARAQDAIAWGEIRGLGFALIAIGAILLAIFRAAPLAAVAMLPNALPVAMAFGAMGLLAIPLDAGTVVLGNLALGIAVDDTLHVVVGFTRAREAGKSPEGALAASYRHALAPLVYTSIAVALGFAILGLSGFTVTRHLGLVTAAIMLLCLAADLLLLPILLLRVGRRVSIPT
jgi:predicted RND superfamily exporter protein